MEMYEKLELIAKCMREGREVELRYEENKGWRHFDTRDAFSVYPGFEYRVKPEKPTVAYLNVQGDVTAKHAGIPFCQITPEVRSALEDAGIDLT